MCCLKYEHPLYQEFTATAPAVGETVETPEGVGRVVAHQVPADAVVVRLQETGRRCACPKASVCAPRQAHDQAYGGAAREPTPSAEPGGPAET
jgi:cell fate regulator YaaT (PSP1 superfamily)